jgi:vancomycin resistance protein YoaR
MSFRTRAIVALGVLLLAAGGAFAAQRALLPPGRALPGLRVEGVALPDDVASGDEARLSAWLAARNESMLDRRVQIRIGAEARSLELRQVVAPVDASALAHSILAVGREGTLAARIDQALRARAGGVDLPIPVFARIDALERLAAELKAKVDEPPADARLDLGAHQVVRDRQGHFVDLDGAVATLATTLSTRATFALRGALGPEATLEPVTLALSTVSARVTADALAKLEIGTVVGSFETHFGRGGDQAPRAVNIETAAKKLDGLVLEPGELLSFNAAVGERSEANGFKLAWEIFKGELRPGVGGGTCQVASTFHAAAFFGGLEILERSPHSRPSAYIPMGLDSTVVYPVVDLKLKNTHPFPVVVHTKVGANTLTVELLGREKPATVVFAREVVDTYPYHRKVEEEPWVKAGQAIKKQGGIRGYRVKRTRTLKYASGIRTETSYDVYPPTTEIYVVAPGTDPKALPPLPDDVREMLAKKSGEPLPSPDATDAVACAGDCEKPPLEVKNGAGVHDPVGDQVAPGKSVSIAH